MLLSADDQYAHTLSAVTRVIQTSELEKKLALANADATTPHATLAELRFMTWLTRQGGFEDVKPLVGRPGYWAGLHRLMLHWSIQGGRIGDKVSIEIRYCYTSDREPAAAALSAWDGRGDPEGWHRDPITGRRRLLADAGLEYIQW